MLNGDFADADQGKLSVPAANAIALKFVQVIYTPSHHSHRI